MKITVAYIIQGFLIGILMLLLGFPIFDHGEFSGKNLLIMVLFIILFNWYEYLGPKD